MNTITKHYINGAFVESHGTEVMDIIKPTNGRLIGRVTLADEEDAKRIVRRLHYRAEVVARTAYGVLPGKRFEGADLTRWLSE